MTALVDTADRPVWSRSQVSSLAECGRKFALGLKSRDAAVDPVYADAARLKRIKNRHLWTGSFVHEAIGGILKAVRQGEPAPAADQLVENLKQKMRDQFLASRDQAEGAERLFEHEYSLPVSPDVWRGHWLTVESSLRWFLSSKWLARLAALGPECWKTVDELLEFDVNGIKAYVKIDCAIEADGKFFLVDWKTSTPSASSEPSLMTAALYAHEVWGAEPDQIEAVAVSLVDGRSFHANVNEDTLMETHLRIEEESAVLEEAKTNLGADPFEAAMTSDTRNCRRCSFQRLCHPKGL